MNSPSEEAAREVVRIPLPTPFPVGPSNAFIIKGDPVVLVDAGTRTDDAYERLVTRLREHGLGVGDIQVILLTHGHLDHAGLMPRILNESRAEAWAHPYVVRQYGEYERVVEENSAFMEMDMRQCGTPPDLVEKFMAARVIYNVLGGPAEIRHTLQDGEMVAGLQAVFVPGHSAGDIVFHDPARRFAFSGDHIIKGMSPNPLMRKPAPGETHSNSLVQYQQSLARTRALDIETCHPGHGSAFNNHIEVIDNILERHDRRTREIGDLLTKGPGTPYNFVMQIFPKLEYRMLHFGLSLVVGHLEILLKRGETEMRDDNGILIWSLTGNSC